MEEQTKITESKNEDIGSESISEKFKKLQMAQNLKKMRSYNALSEEQLRYLNMHGFDPDNIPESLFNMIYYYNNRDGFDREYIHAIGEGWNESWVSYHDICVGDIYGTGHIRYVDRSLLSAFSDLDRGSYIAKKAMQNPEYYDEDWKKERASEYDEPLLIEQGGKLYIQQGNNRLITAKVMYELDLANGMPYEEVRKKYTYKLRTSIMPLDNEITKGIITLQKLMNSEPDSERYINVKYVVCVDNNSTNPTYVANINGNDRELKNIDDIEIAIYAALYKSDSVYNDRTDNSRSR